MIRLFSLAILLLSPVFAEADVKIKVVDEDGNPIRQFEAMYHTADQGHGRWMPGRDGEARLDLYTPRSAVIDVLVRSDEFASATASFHGEKLQTLLAGEAAITLDRGREMQLRLRLPEEMEFADEFIPELFFPEYAWRVRMMWQPHNLRHGQPDLNMLNVKSDGGGVFKLRLAPQPRDFHVAIHHAGWLRFCELGRFSIKDFKDDVLELELPRPASLVARLNYPQATQRELPFERLTYHLMWQLPGMGDAYYSVGQMEQTLDQNFILNDLGPGTYRLQILTLPATSTEKAHDWQTIDPARFTDVQRFELESNESKQVVFDFVPFDKDAFRGDGVARIKVIRADGSPAARRKIKVTFYDGHYGMLTVHDGRIPPDGLTILEGVSTRSTTDSPHGSYTVEVDGERIGFFGFRAGENSHDVEYRLIPKPGDAAPDIELTSVRTAEKRKLSDFRGRVVLLEFWATWCGPCQPAMDKLHTLAKSHREAWGDQVVIVPLSIDTSMDDLRRHIEQRGWTELDHWWTAREASGGFSPAEAAFVVHGVPTALLIDGDGTIAWRGHPLEESDGHNMQIRIERLLEGKSIGSIWNSNVLRASVVSACVIVPAFVAARLALRRRISIQRM